MAPAHFQRVVRYGKLRYNRHGVACIPVERDMHRRQLSSSVVARSGRLVPDTRNRGATRCDRRVLVRSGSIVARYGRAALGEHWLYPGRRTQPNDKQQDRHNSYDAAHIQTSPATHSWRLRTRHRHLRLLLPAGVRDEQCPLLPHGALAPGLCLTMALYRAQAWLHPQLLDQPRAHRPSGGRHRRLCGRCRVPWSGTEGV